MNERATAIAMSSSSSARCQSETATAIATSASVAATLAEADVDRRAHLASSSATAPCPTTLPPSRAAGPNPPSGPPGRGRASPARMRGRARRAGRASVALDRVPRRFVERRGRLVEQQHRGLERERAGQHHPLLLADRELGGVTLRERRGRGRQSSSSPVDVGVAPGEPRAVARCCRRRCPRAAPAAAAPGRPPGEARATSYSRTSRPR